MLSFTPDSEEYSKLEVEVAGKNIVYRTVAQRDGAPSGSGVSLI